MAREGLLAVDITVLGDKELARNLKRLEAKVQKKLLRQSMRQAAKDIILPDAKAKAPVETGRLKATLKVRALPRKRNQIGVRVVTGERDRLGIDESATGYYPFSQEFGWVDKSGRRHQGTPFMRPALYDNKDRVLQFVRKDLGKRVLQEAARNG